MNLPLFYFALVCAIVVLCPVVLRKQWTVAERIESVLPVQKGYSSTGKPSPIELKIFNYA